MMSLPLADDDLVTMARAGSHDAFCTLVERYRAPVVRFAYRLTRDADEANDVAQETFFRAYRNLGSFEPDRSFARWLFAITRNASHDALRRTRRSVACGPAEPAVELGPEELALRNDDELRLRAALDALPERYRSVLDCITSKVCCIAKFPRRSGFRSVRSRRTSGVRSVACVTS